MLSPPMLSPARTHARVPLTHSNLTSLDFLLALLYRFIRRKKEVGCLCKHCENFKGYQTALHSLVQLFEPIVNSNAAVDADDADDNDEDELEAQSWDGLPKLLKLLELCALQSKSDMVKFCLCHGAFERAGKVNCVNGTCPHCGFDKLWSGKDGLRRHVIDEQGNLRADAPIEFSSQVKWRKIGSPKKGEAAGTKYEAKVGTVAELLDEFETQVYAPVLITVIAALTSTISAAVVAIAVVAALAATTAAHTSAPLHLSRS